MQTETLTWLNQLKNGDLKTFDLVYKQYSERLYGFALSILKNHEDAKEIVQETFLRLWNSREQLRADQSLKSYLFKISYNISIDLIRIRLKNEKYVDYLKAHFATDAEEVENLADYNELTNNIQQMIDELPEQRKKVFRMSREHGLSHAEIASQLGISTKTVENHINLALKSVRKKLNSDNLGTLLFSALFL
ncbi:MAG: RNA polymerase sigma-70 factor [Mangrovibacterium sp.]